MNELKVVSINDIDYDMLFEDELIAAINKAHNNGVRSSMIIALLRVYEQIEVNSIIESMED